jgi:hypothetical protein
LPHRLFRLRHQRFYLILIGEIARQHMGTLADLGGERVQNLAPCAGQRHGCALRLQHLGDGAAEAAGRAGHERGLPREIKHAGSFAL